MFEQSLLDTKGKTHKPWTIVVSFLIQCSLIGIAVLMVRLPLKNAGRPDEPAPPTAIM